MSEQKQPETISRNDILNHYTNVNLDTIPDPKLRELVEDKQKYDQELKERGATLKAILDELQAKSIQAHSRIAELNGAVKHVDSKIVQRHIELTGIGK